MEIRNTFDYNFIHSLLSFTFLCGMAVIMLNNMLEILYYKLELYLSFTYRIMFSLIVGHFILSYLTFYCFGGVWISNIYSH